MKLSIQITPELRIRMMHAQTIEIDVPISVSVPEGWKLVPVEPTDAMYDAGKTAGTGEVCKTWDGNGYEFGSPAPIYEAMLAAAPKPDGETI
ncbi:hypothetical protein [Aeromonas veronii]